MKKYIVILVIFLFILVGCEEIVITQDDIANVNNDLLVITEIDRNDESYNTEEAINNNEVVSSVSGYHNKDLLQKFINNFNNGIDDNVRIVNITLEGDAIIVDLEFSGGSIHYTRDSSRDKYGSSLIVEGTFKNLVEQEVKRNGQVYKDIYLYSDDKDQIVIAGSYKVGD